MSYAKQMTDTYPRSFNVDADVLAACIEACYDCAQACTACADACLSEDNVAHLVKCIRTNADCADVCQTSGRVFLPVLVFAASLGLSVRAFLRDLVAILTLATVALVVSTALVGVALYAGLGLMLPLALLFGALISATDLPGRGRGGVPAVGCSPTPVDAGRRRESAE